MIFLTSNGLTSPKLQDEFRKAIENKGKKCVIIPTAMEKDKDRDIWLEETKTELASFGLESDYFYFHSTEKEKEAKRVSGLAPDQITKKLLSPRII